MRFVFSALSPLSRLTRHTDTTFMPDMPQSEIAVPNFDDSGRSLGEELDEMFWAFLCFTCCAD